MDVISELQNKSIVKSEPKLQIYSKELIDSFNFYADNIKVLSLDCFDTLLWRKSAVPTDVFYDLQQDTASYSYGMSAAARISAEAIARQANYVKTGGFEVTLNEIYRAGCPSLNEGELQTLIDAEINAEKMACYAFFPIIELMRLAHKKNIKIIIVSNTYLTKLQLQQLLTHVLPADVMSVITEIFCSCEFGKSKTNGLFASVLEKLALPPEAILHIGDNKFADFDVPRSIKIKALHLLQFNPAMIELLRLQTIAATFGDAMIRHSRALHSPFRGVYAMAAVDAHTPEFVIGYLSMGPVMYAFAAFIVDEIKKLEQVKKQVKTLFLLRDGYLPALACETFLGQPLGKQVRISRFAAVAASFRSKEDVDVYLMDSIAALHFRYICHQLLLSDNLAEQLVAQAEKSVDPVRAFIMAIQQNGVIQQVLSRSADYRARLIEYLKNEVGLNTGDTLCLIDIGYAGTTQRLLAPILKDEMNVEVTGRYLISLDTPEWKLNKSGLLDPSWCDNRTLIKLICSSVALIEEMCTGGGDTVVDYEKNGKPIFSKSNNSAEQYDKIKRIQDECIRFVRDAKEFFLASQTTLSHVVLRDTALSELIRRIYLPMQSEATYLQDFQHDLDKGTKAKFQVFDMENSLNNLRRQGLPFINFHPYGLRAASLDLAMIVMAQRRFGFDVGLNDLSFRREGITVLSVQDQKIQKELIFAVPTHDGYFSLWIPVTNKNSQLAIMFGLDYLAVQIESAELISANAILRTAESANTKNMTSKLNFNQIQHKYGKLFECMSKEGSIIIAPELEATDHQHYFMRITFRPIERRVS